MTPRGQAIHYAVLGTYALFAYILITHPLWT